MLQGCRLFKKSRHLTTGHCVTVMQAVLAMWEMDRLPVQASQEALCTERERAREGEGKRKKAV